MQYFCKTIFACLVVLEYWRNWGLEGWCSVTCRTYLEGPGLMATIRVQSAADGGNIASCRKTYFGIPEWNGKIETEISLDTKR